MSGSPVSVSQKSEKEEVLRAAAEPARLFTLPPNADGRVIMVGDVHGCLDELDALLAKLQYSPEADDLILVGDLVGKGPASLGVLDRARSLPRCHCILGNHDWTLLRWRDACEKGETEVLYSRKEGNEYPEMAKRLSPEQAAYVRSWGHLLHVPQYNVLCVHAGLMPYSSPPTTTAGGAVSGLDAAVAATSSYDMMHVRHCFDDLRAVSEVDLKGGSVGASGDGVAPWAERLPAGRDTVVFGHDALRRLQDRRAGNALGGKSLGLDTGCCYGGQLTAWVLPTDEIVAVDSQFSCLAPPPPTAE